jgi:hypothetical protein
LLEVDALAIAAVVQIAVMLRPVLGTALLTPARLPLMVAARLTLLTARFAAITLIAGLAVIAGFSAITRFSVIALLLITGIARCRQRRRPAQERCGQRQNDNSSHS